MCRCIGKIYRYSKGAPREGREEKTIGTNVSDYRERGKDSNERKFLGRRCDRTGEEKSSGEDGSSPPKQVQGSL